MTNTQHAEELVERIAITIATYQGYRYAGLSLADKKFYTGQASAVLDEVFGS